MEARDPFSQDDLDKISQSIGRELPEAYCAFVLEYGAAFVAGLVDGSPDLPVLGFFDPERILSTLKFLDGFKDVVPFAGCELGNIWIFDKNGGIHYVNNYGGQRKVDKISNDFVDFIGRIQPEDA